MKEDEGVSRDNGEIDFQRQAKKLKLKQLGDYENGYNSDRFIEDLIKYFEGEIDFNLDKIRKKVETPLILPCLIAKAKEKDTHPVVEFVEELFKDFTT